MEISRISPRDKKKAELDGQCSESATAEAFDCVLLSFPENRFFTAHTFKLFNYFFFFSFLWPMITEQPRAQGKLLLQNNAALFSRSSLQAWSLCPQLHRTLP